MRFGFTASTLYQHIGIFRKNINFINQSKSTKAIKKGLAIDTLNINMKTIFVKKNMKSIFIIFKKNIPFYLQNFASDVKLIRQLILC